MQRPLATLLLLLTLGAVNPAQAAPRFRAVADDIFYMYMPIAWRDSDSDPWRFGDFDGMTGAIPYLKSLGVTAVWMTPVFVSPAYHGYQHGRADSLNTRFGSDEQFWSFVGAAHAESIKVFLDFVVYGTSQNTEWYQDSYGNPASVYDSWLAYTNEANTSYLGCCPYPTWDGTTVGFIHWDLRHPDVTQLVTDWAIHWLDPDGNGDPSDGVDGFRADHVSSYDPVESPWGYDLAWWQTWKSALRAVAPDVFTFAEQADWGYGFELLPAFDAAFTKPFEFAAREGLAIADARLLASRMETTTLLKPSDRLFLTTLGNHDVSRLATVLGDDPGRLRAAASVLMLQPLPPVIYFGDEIGMRGAKRSDFSGDAADIPFREPFKWNAIAGPPMSNYFALNAQAYSERVSRDLDGRSVEEQSGVPGSLLEHYRSLTALRHAHSGLRHGSYFGVATADTSVWTFLKTSPDETLLVAVNVGPRNSTVAIDLSLLQLPVTGSPVKDVESGVTLDPLTIENQGAYPLALGSYAHRVVRLSAAPRDLRTLYADANRVITQDAPELTGFDHIFELDQMFVRFDPAGLALGLTGNLLGGGYGLAIFFDAAPGGQNTLQTQTLPQPPSGIPQLAGLRFDSGFVPEKVVFFNLFNDQLYADLFTLETEGGGSKRYLGTVPVGSSAALTGGDNPHGLTVRYAPYNRGGIRPGFTGGAESATDGFSILVPWSDLGLSGAGPSLRLMAMLTIPDGYIFNQFLPGLGDNAGPLGYPPVDLNAIAGAQYVTLDQTTATLASQVSIEVTAGIVEILWQLEEQGVDVRVERRTASTPWQPLAQLASNSRGLVRMRDASAQAGARYGYRLLRGSDDLALAEAWVDVPPAPRLALRRVGGEPGSGRILVTFATAGGVPMRLEAFDIHGRRVAASDLGIPESGEHEARLGGNGGLRSGTYFVKLQAGKDVRIGRAVVVR